MTQKQVDKLLDKNPKETLKMLEEYEPVYTSKPFAVNYIKKDVLFGDPDDVVTDRACDLNFLAGATIKKIGFHKKAQEGGLGSFVQADAVEHLQKLPENSIDLVLLSPPYDLIRTYNGFALDLKALGDQLFRVAKDGAIIAVVINDGTKDFAKSLTTARLQVDWVDRVGLRLFEMLVYSRHGRPGGWWNQRFRVDHEYLPLFLKGSRPRCFDKSHLMIPSKYAGTEWHGTDRKTDGGLSQVEKGRALKEQKCRGTIWKYSASCTEGNRLKLQHPATFPDKLAEDLIGCFSKENDLVLDPTCGSGTTCVVAARMGRRFLGIDSSAEYIDICRARLAKEAPATIL